MRDAKCRRKLSGMSVIFIATSGFLAMALLFLLWVVSLFALVFDDISFLAKIVWFVFLTIAAPISIPVYFFLRIRRHRATPAAG